MGLQKQKDELQRIERERAEEREKHKQQLEEKEKQLAKQKRINERMQQELKEQEQQQKYELEKIEKERAEERWKYKQELDKKEKELLLALKDDREIGLQNLGDLMDCLTYEKMWWIFWRFVRKTTEASRRFLEPADEYSGPHNLSPRFCIREKRLDAEATLKEI